MNMTNMESECCATAYAHGVADERDRAVAASKEALALFEHMLETARLVGGVPQYLLCDTHTSDPSAPLCGHGQRCYGKAILDLLGIADV
jgi:hypothetical protein